MSGGDGKEMFDAGRKGNPADAPEAQPPRVRAIVGASVYLVLFAALGFGVVYGLRLRCEGFGCMGLGVYWFAWSVVCAVSGLIGLWARSATRRAGVAAGPVRWALWAHLLMGLALLVWWWSAS